MALLSGPSFDKYELAHKAWPILIREATAGRLLNYIQLSKELYEKPAAQAMRHALAPIQDLCIEKGLPPITSIVINKGTRRPGPGFYATHGDLAAAHRLVWAYQNWPSVPRPFPPDHLKKIAPGRTEDKRQESDSDYGVPDSQVLVNGRGPFQDRFRRSLLAKYGGQCALCKTRLESVLIASHIVPWSSDPANRLNPRNGILLCRTHDALFEAGVIKIAQDYKVEISALDESIVGKDLLAFITNCTSAILRLPEERYHPSIEFLKWRVDNMNKKWESLDSERRHLLEARSMPLDRGVRRRPVGIEICVARNGGE